MFRLYSPILILQLFCLYHAYKHSKDYGWYLLVLFLPLIGSLIYLYVHFATRTNIDATADHLERAFTKDATIKKMEQEPVDCNTESGMPDRILSHQLFIARSLT